MTSDILQHHQATDGRDYHIPTPGHAHVRPNGKRARIFTDNDRESILPALLLSGLALD